ncbi:hypothetical protein [Burkholderia cepacia]|uniref:Uncharacterized protein n=1 Tax=Burkholderia cepacia TaxID=292 RepID=A0A8I1AJL4_BURCE|nr:hypothetical protein [Burkholderia cepacia]MBH9685120.1 hypothetical protein [Burkholderia cepacia]MBH9697963.1 hypothetical protein [Burkholderia cepacia]MBH9717673.1 hypothetical protein [Burkholderia cepacia]MBH9733548.1 hypothetical protein [Burkholderia cepacia]MBX3759905.1 hypothetical protein [Burkholderia cepacia]
MESTFSAEYQTTRQADGSLLISYRSKAYHAPGFMAQIALLIPLALFYLVLTAAALYSAPIFGVIMLGLFIWFLVVIVRGISRSVTVIPQQGIMWSNKQLPFRDINRFGITRVTTNRGQSGYVFAESQGREIIITRHISMSLANAICEEIQREAISNQPQ